MDTAQLNTRVRQSGNDEARLRLASGIWEIVTLGDRIGRRTAIVLWLGALTAIGLLAGWRWIAAAGLASTVLAFLPCVAMCALGMCAGDKGKKCSDASSTDVPRKPGA